MSEYYLVRRNSITDLAAFFGFLTGFLGSAPIAWPFLQVGFQTGEITKGFAYFLAIVVGAGVLCGVVGLGVGRAGGWLWERTHRYLRSARGRNGSNEDLVNPFDRVAAAEHPAGEGPSAASPATAREVPGAVQATSPFTASRTTLGARHAAAGSSRPADGGSLAPANAGVRFGDAPPRADDYASLLARTGGTPEADVATLDRALRQTRNFTAWAGDRLVGIARVFTDGHRLAILAELVVDGDYRGRGIGTGLMRLAAAAHGTLSLTDETRRCQDL